MSRKSVETSLKPCWWETSTCKTWPFWSRHCSWTCRAPPKARLSKTASNLKSFLSRFRTNLMMPPDCTSPKYSKPRFKKRSNRLTRSKRPASSSTSRECWTTARTWSFWESQTESSMKTQFLTRSTSTNKVKHSYICSKVGPHETSMLILLTKASEIAILTCLKTWQASGVTKAQNRSSMWSSSILFGASRRRPVRHRMPRSCSAKVSSISRRPTWSSQLLRTGSRRLCAPRWAWVTRSKESRIWLIRH